MPHSSSVPHRTGSSTSGVIRVGISGWTYKPWRGTFYPQGLPHNKELAFASAALSSIEINGTFYSLQRPATYASWFERTPPGFVFSVKGPRYITHIRRLQNVEEAMQRFLPTLQPLASQLGPVLFQLPPTAKADVAVLRDFLALLPRNFKAAFEFRHESWFTDQIYQTLHDHNATLCVAETEKLNTPEIRTASYIYFRFRQPSYSADELKKLEERIEKCVADGLETYAFFKHEEDPRSPHNAVEMLNSVRSNVGAEGSGR